jgi:phage regulator Rha-like protein
MGQIMGLILILRGQKVMLDRDIAELYGITTKALNQAVKRNKGRFPNDFLFQLNKEEKEELVTICDRFKNLKYSSSLPFAFTEHGTLMAAMVLNSQRATEMSVYVIRAFIKMREVLGQNKELLKKLSHLERRVSGHDENIKTIIEAIRGLMEPLNHKNHRIGFSK